MIRRAQNRLFRRKRPALQALPKGQSIIIVALIFVVLLGFVGLTIDIGRAFIEWAQLRRAVDAASLGAAAQIREGRLIGDLTAIAREMLEVNGITPTEITVEDCKHTLPPNDPPLCPDTPRRKYVRVTASTEVVTSFLLLFGFDRIPITATAVGEAASLDVVLVIDISESMAWDAAADDPMRDPHACNEADPSGAEDGWPGNCHPFQEVKQAAVDFTKLILDRTYHGDLAEEEEDRLAIVTFSNGARNAGQPDEGTFYRSLSGASLATRTWINDYHQAEDLIRNLTIFDPGECFTRTNPQTPLTTTGPCRNYYMQENGSWQYGGIDCLSCRDAGDQGYGEYPDTDGPPNRHEWSYLPTTNIGGALYKAGMMFPFEKREEALWVTILLTDGVATSTDWENDDNPNQVETLPLGYCPYADIEFPLFPMCQDKDVSTRHTISSPVYDADDFARDAADFVACPDRAPHPGCAEPGQMSLVYAIAMGEGVLDTGCPTHFDTNYGYLDSICEAGPDHNSDTEEFARPYGAELMRYIADVGEDYRPNNYNANCGGRGYNEDCGNYYYAEGGYELNSIFEDIASRIFTRIHQ